MSDFRHKTYDLAFSLGAACSCSQTLRYAGFAASTPFQLFVNRLQYEIWRFFARRFARKGMDCGV